MRRARARLSAMFAAADTNKDGKLTKDELANFVWKRFAKADANGDQAVTKEELQNFAKQRVAALRAEHPRGRRHHAKADASKSKDEKSKGETAKPKPTPAPTGSQPKAEPKAEAKPAGIAVPAAAQVSPPSKTTAGLGSKSPVPSKGVSKAEGSPAASKNTGPKIGTSTTSGDVKAALFAARR
jgi:hypothetical protein